MAPFAMSRPPAMARRRGSIGAAALVLTMVGLCLRPARAPQSLFAAPHASRVTAPCGASSSGLGGAGRSWLGLAGPARGAATRLRADPVVGNEFAPGDLLSTYVFAFVVPLIIGLILVYILFIVKPDAILTGDQMLEYKRLEKRKELERRGAKTDESGETRNQRRANLRKKLRGQK
mmetsp:Transcript_58419/g.131613  ORF Transcript_58419/g.131613 Transcript_58419/m.131613 type:complete len:176 (+) Transcript_58419:33-560(+)